jgi:bifunctional non-homologous end joining protein LigD
MPSFQPLPLVRRPHAFSHPDWVYEIKYDGFRALAYVDGSGTRLISRNGSRFASLDPLCQSMAFFLRAKNAVLDGEIVCLDENGHAQFNELLSIVGIHAFARSTCCH